MDKTNNTMPRIIVGQKDETLLSYNERKERQAKAAEVLRRMKAIEAQLELNCKLGKTQKHQEDVLNGKRTIYSRTSV